MVGLPEKRRKMENKNSISQGHMIAAFIVAAPWRMEVFDAVVILCLFILTISNPEQKYCEG